MRAAVIHAHGPAEAIRVESVPVPRPARAEVLVRVQATAVNHVDTFVRSGAYRTAMTFPFVVGRDLVGTVDGVGDAVDGFRPGDAVWCASLGHDGRQGAASEFAVVPQDRLYTVPTGVDPLQLVALAHPACTAWLALFRHGRLDASDTLFVGGGAGNVGRCAVALGRAAGARVVASARSVAELLAAGAVAIDYRSPDLERELGAALPGGADVWLDTSGTLALPQAVPLLAERGRIVLIAGAGRRDTLAFGDLYTHDRAVLGFAISNATADELGTAARAVGEALAAGILPAPVIERWPLERAAEAHAALESGRAAGIRIVLETGGVSPTP